MKLLITESQNFSLKAISELKNHFEVDIRDIVLQQELVDIIKNYDVIFVRLRFKFTKEILENTSQLKFILTATTGLDHIDVGFFESNGGKVISLKNETNFLGTIPSTAEHTWALLLSLIKKIPVSFDDVKKHNWNRDIFKGNNLKDKKIGILGLGRVGKQVANFAEVFQMEVAYFDTNFVESKFKNFNTPEELFFWADIITIHIPYTLENDNFVNEKLLSHCKNNALLINTSRGNLWDENAIAKLLEQGKIKGVATDVLQDEFDKEIISRNLLINLAIQKHNIIITPHIAGATYESMEMTENFITNKFINYIQNKN